jgi:hypothetical protein
VTSKGTTVPEIDPAFGRRAAAWPVFGVTVVLITIAQLFDTAVGPTGVLLILGIVLAGVGFLRAATRKEMLLQALGLVGFGPMALLAAGATPLLGAYVAALGLLSHAVWDEYHHHADRVVARSFARFCATLDYTLAAIVVSLTTFTAVN